MVRDDRTKAEKAAWKAGEFTEDEVVGTGLTAAEANRQREIDERELGNQIAPPE